MRKKQEESNNHTTAVTLNKRLHIQYLSAGSGGAETLQCPVYPYATARKCCL